MKKKLRDIFIFLAIPSVFALAVVGCGGGGDNGGGGGNSELNGVWRMDSLTEWEDEECQNVTFPLQLPPEEGGGTLSPYIEITNNNKSKFYAKISGSSPVSEWSDGVYKCSENELHFTIDGNKIIGNDGDESTFELTANTLIINDVVHDCQEVFNFTKADESEIVGAIEEVEPGV
jgi:hypothetical protein